jgi:hypothetical protein
MPSGTGPSGMATISNGGTENAKPDIDSAKTKESL